MLTNKQIQALPAPTKGFSEHSVNNSSFPGLRVRVTANGVKTFIFRYKVAKKSFVLTIERVGAITLQEACQKATEFKAMLTLGRNPAEEIQEQKRAHRNRISTQDEENPKFGAIWARYIESYASKKKKSWQEDNRAIQRHAIATLAQVRVQSITRRDIAVLLNTLSTQQKFTTANHVRSYLNAFFNWCIRQGVLDANPVALTERARPKSRSRVLSDDEIVTLMTQDVGRSTAMLRMILASAQRPGEVQRMKWCDLRPRKEAGAGLWWFLTDTKNGHNHSVPVSSLMQSILNTVEKTNSPYVFPTLRASTKRKHLGWGEACLGMAALFPYEGRATAHDLRRTAATLISMQGFDRGVQNKVLNHVDNSIAGIYDRYDYAKEKRAALEALADKVRSIAGLNVYPLSNLNTLKTCTF